MSSVSNAFGGNALGVLTGFDPAGVITQTGLAGGQFGSLGQFIADPLDIFGIRAGQAQDEITDILRQSAQANIDLQEDQLRRVAEQTAPFRQLATDTALPALSSLALGGPVDFQPSQLFEAQTEAGRRGILRGQAAGGAGVKSSRTFERLSDLVSGLAGEDLARFEQGQQNLLNQGVLATGQLGAAGGALTGNISSALSGLGSSLNEAQRQFGQARQASFQGLQSGLGGLSQFLASR